MIRRINIYGGPGSGKSTTAAGLFSKLKQRTITNGIPIKLELVTEYVKQWTYDGRSPQGFFQNYIWARQQHTEEVALRAKVDVIVTDCPLLMCCCYADKYKVPTASYLAEMTALYEKQYPALHILLRRNDRPYVQLGRWQNQNEASEMDIHIKSFLMQNTINFFEVDSGDQESLEKLVFDKLGINYE